MLAISDKVSVRISEISSVEDEGRSGVFIVMTNGSRLEVDDETLADYDAVLAAI